jgi:hypothetical protein
MNTLKFIGIALLVLLAIFIGYGIYFAVVAYFFVIKIIVITLIISAAIFLYYSTKRPKE